MIQNRNRNSEPKPPNKMFQKLLIALGLLAVILAFFGGIATAVLFLNWKKVFNEQQLRAILSPSSTTTPSPSPATSLSPSPLASPSPSPVASPSPSPTTSPSPPSEPKTLNSNIVQQQGLIIKLQKCQKSAIDTKNQKITCVFSITSEREDVQVSLYANSSQSNRSRIVYGGDEKNATQVKLGSYAGKSYVKNNLAKNAALTADFTFEPVPSQVKTIGLLEIILYLESSYFTGYIKINEFRDIPLSE